MLSLFRARARLERGGVVFLSGSPGSGRTALLDRLRAEFRALESPPAVGLARLDATPADPKALDPALGVLTGSLALLGATVAQPVLGLIGTVVSVSNAARKLALAARDAQHHGLDLAARILRAAAEERPLVLLVDDADQIEGSWWSDLLQGFASEIARDLPLFVVMTVDGPVALGAQSDDEPDWLSTARRLVGQDVAEWRPVGLVTGDQVREWIGSVSGDTVRRLVELTGGLATVTSERWEDWRSLGIVELGERTGEWGFSASYSDRIHRGAGDVVRRRLATLVADSGPRQQAYDVLARAALEGRRFTPAAVAHAAASEPDDVIARLSGITQTEERRSASSSRRRPRRRGNAARSAATRSRARRCGGAFSATGCCPRRRSRPRPGWHRACWRSTARPIRSSRARSHGSLTPRASMSARATSAASRTTCSLRTW